MEAPRKSSKHIFTFVLISLIGAVLNFSTFSLKFPEQLAQALVLYLVGSAIFATGVVGTVWYIRLWCKSHDAAVDDSAAIVEAESSFVKTLPCEYPPSLPQMYQHAPTPSWVSGNSVYPVIQK